MHAIPDSLHEKDDFTNLTSALFRQEIGGGSEDTFEGFLFNGYRIDARLHRERNLMTIRERKIQPFRIFSDAFPKARLMPSVGDTHHYEARWHGSDQSCSKYISRKCVEYIGPKHGAESLLNGIVREMIQVKAHLLQKSL